MGNICVTYDTMTKRDLHREAPQVPQGFRDLIKRQMDRVNLSLRTVASEVGVSPAYLSRLLSGERGLPPDDALILRLADALQIAPPERLLVEAKRVPDMLLPALLSAHEAVSDADLKEAMKQLQAVIHNMKRKRGRA
ncbi:MAG: helix-turn-helix domain-containing protein [Nitrospiraceae bacterium]|nr:helix-turn-helix domain-containing protein [Nitrospiraceae bacterium]